MEKCHSNDQQSEITEHGFKVYALWNRIRRSEKMRPVKISCYNANEYSNLNNAGIRFWVRLRNSQKSVSFHMLSHSYVCDATINRSIYYAFFVPSTSFIKPFCVIHSIFHLVYCECFFYDCALISYFAAVFERWNELMEWLRPSPGPCPRWPAPPFPVVRSLHRSTAEPSPPSLSRSPFQANKRFK